MTRDSTETPPVGGPTLQSAPEAAREAAVSEAESLDSLEALPVPEVAEENPPPMSAFMETLPEDTLPEPELFGATPSGEPAEIDPDKLDPDGLKVIHRLHAHGHQAYFVGGCVRDLLLGRRPKDFDIATSAHPGEVRAIFRNCRLIGRRFRLAHIYFKGGKIIEVSTFRANPTELDATNGESAADTGAENGEEEGNETEESQNQDLLITHDNVFGTAEQDARRRDFTMNGLFYDVAEGRVIDYVRGRRDLDERYIRTIGDPEIRMREDPVRILRAVRFASKLGLDIESRTYAAMEGAVEDLPRCAPARLLEETFRLIRGGVAAPCLRLLSALDALKILLPPVAAYLKENGRRGQDTFYAFVEALDRRVSSGEPLDDSILLAALLVPISQAAPPPVETQQDPARPSVAQAIEDLLAEFVQTARLPRRIAERCRLLLVAQRTLTGERRRRSGAFRRHPLFHDALIVFEISVEASGQHREAFEAWKRGEVPPLKPAEGAAPEGEAPRKRRRRRRRSGRKPGAGEGAAATASGGAEASGGEATDSGEAGDESDSGAEESGGELGADSDTDSESDEG